MNYSNGLEIKVTDVVRIKFLDIVDADIKVVGEVAFVYDGLKQLNKQLTKLIEEHDVKLAKLAE